MVARIVMMIARMQTEKTVQADIRAKLTAKLKLLDEPPHTL